MKEIDREVRCAPFPHLLTHLLGPRVNPLQYVWIEHLTPKRMGEDCLCVSIFFRQLRGDSSGHSAVVGGIEDGVK